MASFWPVLHCDFINFDDTHYVTESPHVRAGLTWPSIAWAFRSTVSCHWHPLTLISHMLDCQLYGLSPAGHHLTSLLFHVANTLGLFLVLRRMTGAVWRSAMVAALFAIHPLRVESVAWVAERKDVLSTFFFMLTLLAYVRYVRKLGSRKENAETGARCLSAGHYWLSLFFFALGLMSKPMLVTLPFILLLLDYWPLGRLEASGFSFQLSTLRRLLLEKLPFFALTIASSAITFHFQRSGGMVVSTDTLPIKLRLGNALISYFRYLRKMFWPSDLAFIYPHPGAWPAWQVLGAGLFLVAVSIVVVGWTRRRPYLLVGWLWFLGTLVPVIGLVQLAGPSMADRFVYVPLIGVFIMLVWGVGDLTATWRHRPAVLGGAAVAVLAGLGGATYVQTTYWKDSLTLWTHSLARTSNNFVAHSGLGGALAKQGQWSEAIRQWELALKSNPHCVEAHINLAGMLVSQGKWDEAIQHYEQALKYAPDLAEAHSNLGALLGRKGQWDEAIPHYQQAIEADPRLAEAHNNLGVALGQKGQWDAAIVHYQKALEIQPDNPDPHYGLGLALARTGQWEQAIAHYQKALIIEPGALRPQNKLAWLLATCPRAALRNGTQALGLAREVDRVSGGDNPDYLDTLAAAYAEAGQFAEAVEAAGRALALAVAQTNPHVEEIRARLKLYQDRSPYHETVGVGHEPK